MPAQPHLFLATPCYGGQVSIFFLRAVLALQAACEARGVGLHVELLENDALITRAPALSLIRRAARERARAAHPELGAALSDLGPGGADPAMVFDTMIEAETGQHLSEDYAFCRRWRDLGGDIWADMESRLTHVGHAAY